MRRGRRRLILAATLLILPAALFVVEGTRTDWMTPEIRTSADDAAAAPAPGRQRLRIATWNLAKADFHRGGLRFAARSEVRSRLDAMAHVMRKWEPDLIVLTEVVDQTIPFKLDHADYIANALDMNSWVFGANYSFGLPRFRIQAGKAILSRDRLTHARAIQLAGARPFWNPTNNRRLLVARFTRRGESWHVAAIRNDSYSVPGNLIHAHQVFDACSAQPSFLIGDFNATPESKAMGIFRAAGRWVGAFDGPATLRGDGSLDSERRIDYVLAPAGWKLVSERVVETSLSDHRPVIADFERP